MRIKTKVGIPERGFMCSYEMTLLFIYSFHGLHIKNICNIILQSMISWIGLLKMKLKEGKGFKEKY